YMEGKYDRVVLAYTDYVSSLKQEPRIKQLLPIPREEDVTLGGVGETVAESGEKADLREYIFEPSPVKVLERMLPRLIETQIYQAVLESDASEHSARMMAMKNATEAAHDLIGDLTLAFNQARQAGITQEIAEISGTKAAMSNTD
ncbi:MAG TPA: FoF1 ATP synthase subunit gamma, partial [Patescibacteria group bacterium]|nr:FoF1 ATP synthase subunit gamma [Patescibacteria group bacterium]